MNLLQTIEREIVEKRARAAIDLRPGDTVRVHVEIQEGNKSRIQVFEGTVIRIKKGGPRTTFTVRKLASGVGVERIFPAGSPNVKKIEITARHKVRRAKLHYLRDRAGKAARLKPIRDFVPLTTEGGELTADGAKPKRKKRGKKRRAALRAATQQD